MILEWKCIFHMDIKIYEELGHELTRFEVLRYFQNIERFRS